MITDKNYYRILEIPTEATEEQVKIAYRRLVKRWHPDLNGGSIESQEKLKEVNEAYEVLSDVTARYMYNETIQVNEQTPMTASGKAKTESKEDQRRKEKVRDVYESRSTSSEKYYSDFEKIIEEYKNDRCDSGLVDKFNILYGDACKGSLFSRLYLLPPVVTATILWHGCDLVSRVFDIFFEAIFKTSD